MLRCCGAVCMATSRHPEARAIHEAGIFCDRKMKPSYMVGFTADLSSPMAQA